MPAYEDMFEITPNKPTLILAPARLLENFPTFAAILINLTNKNRTKSAWFV